MKKTDKEFDCIKFKREVQAQIYKEIKDLGPEDEVKYFHLRAASGPLGAWWKKASAGKRKAEARVVAEKREGFSKG